MQSPIFGIDAVRVHHNNINDQQYKRLVTPHVSGPIRGQQYFYNKRIFQFYGKHNAISIQSSVLKFADHKYNGIGLATGDDIERGIVAFEAQSGLAVRHAPVTRIEMAAMFEATLSPEVYFGLIRPKTNYEIVAYPNGCYQRSKESQIVIYNKTQELRDKGKLVLDPSTPQLIKVELRLNKKLRQKIAPWLRVLDFESLSDPNVLHSLARIYESYTTRLLGLDDFITNTSKRLTTADFLNLAAEEMRVRRAHEHEEVLSEILDMYRADRRTRNSITKQLEKERLYSSGSEVRHHIKGLCKAWYEKYPISAVADPAIRDYMDRLREFSENRRTTEAEKQDKRAAQEIIASSVL